MRISYPVKRNFITAFLLFSLLFIGQLHATHLMGGSMTYEYTGMQGTDQSYKVTLKIYRYCDASAGGTAPLDNSMFLGVYNQDINNPNADKNWFMTGTLNLISSSFITPPSPGINCPFTSTVCVEEGIFEANILLPPDPGGYHLIVERCCRNGNIVNLSNPGGIGQTYYCYIPPAPIINSTPQLTDIPVPYLCTGDTLTLVNNAVDPDGDSLVYSFETPFAGYSGTIASIPDPQIDNNPYAFPIPPVLYNPGYSVNQPFGAGGYSYVDPQTGLTKYYIPNQGFYVVAIEIKEYRNGVLVSSIRRDLQLIAIACPVNASPSLSFINGSGTTNYVITEGQTLCFPITFTDSNGDSLYLTSSGNIFNSAITNPPASLANASGDGFVSSQFCWSTDCGQAKNTPYQFVVSVTDNGCPPKVKNLIYSIKVNPSPLPPAPAVSIVSNPSGPICIGTQVTFTAMPTFGGTNPVYQWQLNGVNVGNGTNTYTSSTLNNGDVITVQLTSNSVCVSNFTAVSPPVVMVVNPFAAPSVSITPNPAGTICSGSNVTFTANPVNPGATPVYQWTLNGANVGTNSPTYSSSTLSMGSMVAVSLTSNAGCPAAISNSVTMTVEPVLTPSITITSDNTGAICPGELVTFRAYATNGGPAPVFQWLLNGVNVGTNSNIYTNSTLVNGDNVQCVLTSNETCLTAPTANSNVIVISVNNAAVPSVSITANPSGPICKNDNIVFTASPVAGGTSPTYQWKINGVNVGGGGAAFSSSTLNNGDQVSVVLTSSLTCVAPNTATSNVITVTVNPLLTPSISITPSPSSAVCDGSPITFTATPVNGGTTPYYQWQVNGANVGTNNPVFASSVLNDGDVVRVLLTSNAYCISATTVSSNLITVTILPLVTPTITITPHPSGPICAGDSVSFIASTFAAGAGAVYQWYVNNQPVGTNNNVYISGSLSDGDVIKAELTSTAQCANPVNVTSNSIVMQVNPVLVPTVSLSMVPTGPVCQGTPITFTANITNGGTTPIYQWQLNGTATGGNTSTLTFPNLSDGDSVRVRLTSNAVCVNPPSVWSVAKYADVKPYVTPQVSIVANPAGPVCDGDTIRFTATPTNGGTSPVYHWLLNGNPTGTNANTLAGVFNDLDTIKVVLISSEQCLLAPNDTSNQIVTHVNPNLTPAVSIVASPNGPYCPNEFITFTATPTNGGTLPSYQWMVNGVNVGSNNAVYSTASLANGDKVKVLITSSEVCVTTPTSMSNIINVQILPNVAPDVVISVIPAAPVCDGDTLSFSAVPSGAGSNPTYSWMVNGVPAGVSTSTFVTNTLSNGDVVDVVITSSASCALPLTDTSNQIIPVIDPLLTPIISLFADPAGTFCDGKEITYFVNTVHGGLNPAYTWYLNGNNLFVNNDSLVSSIFLDGDSLTVELNSSERCLAVNPVSSNLIVIDRLPPLSPVVTGPSEVCIGKEVTISVQSGGGNSGPYYYTWDQNLGTDSVLTFSPAQTTTYTVTVNDSCSTPRSTSITVQVNPLPVPAFTIEPPRATILNPFFDFVDASLNTTAWQWFFGDNSTSYVQYPQHTYLEPGTYPIELIATSDKGCVDSTFSEVVVDNVVIFYVPNSFTPNNDGINDVFGVTGYSVSGYQLSIYNRWGQEIFKSKGNFDVWDGKDSSGNELPVGVYVYKLKVFNDPEKKIRTGTVSLIR